MTELERIIEAEMRIGALERRLEASERRNAQTIEARAMEFKKVHERLEKLEAASPSNGER